MGYKSVTNKTCEQFKVEFPLYKSMLMGDSATEHRELSKKWVNEKEKNDEIVAYQGSYTMSPNATKEARLLAREACEVMMYYYYTTYNIPNMIFGCNAKFKVDAMVRPLGFKYLENNGVRMDQYEAESFF